MGQRDMEKSTVFPSQFSQISTKSEMSGYMNAQQNNQSR